MTSNFYQPLAQMQLFDLTSGGGCLPLDLGSSAEDDAAEEGLEGLEHRLMQLGGC
jgi:hypothetical protein